jgi:ABC-2 type transport system ATP-binding protein
VTVARPSLDDVYLRHTGRRYSQADPAETTSAGDAKELLTTGVNE